MCQTHVVDTLLLELAKELNHGISLSLDPKIEIRTMKKEYWTWNQVFLVEKVERV
jgi:hypothetical protein